MIGDWVIEKDRVCRVSFNTTIEEVRKEDCATSASSSTRYYDIEPITLTPEILEKNGFHAYSDVSQEWFIGVFKDGNKYLELTYSKGDIDWTINGDEYCIAPIKYVHELQHLLKLYGIKKEIVL